MADAMVAWSLDVFTLMLRKATPEYISKLDCRKVPEVIPDKFTEQFETEKRIAIEELIFDANAHHFQQQQLMAERFGDALADALRLAGIASHTESTLKLKSALRSLVNAYKEHKNDSHREQLQIYAPMIEHASASLDVVKSEMGSVVKGIHEVKKQLNKADEYLPKFQKGLHNLEDSLARYEYVIGMYFHIRIVIASNTMTRLRDSFVDLDAKAQAEQNKIDSAREELKNLQDYERLSRNDAIRKIVLRTQIAESIEEMKNYEVIISETELMTWLDVIVEADANKVARKKGMQAIRTARLTLFSLLQRYCELQEAAAQQIARNPFSQADPKKTIQFLMRSEQFVLDFFAKKKATVMAWLGSAAEERIRGLEKMESELLSEMKQNVKKLR